MKKLLSVLCLACLVSFVVSCGDTTSSSVSSSTTSSTTSSSTTSSSTSPSSVSSEVAEDSFVVTKKSDVIYKKGTAINWDDFVTYTYIKDGVETTCPEVTTSEAVNGRVEVTFTCGDLLDKETFDIYYAVSSVADWAAMNDDLTAYYALTSDIDFKDVEFVTIGHSVEQVGDDYKPVAGTNAFSGVFDGNGYALKNAKLSVIWDDFDGVNWGIADVKHYSFGVFGVVAGTVRNFEIVDAFFASINFSGLVASMVSETGLVQNVLINNCDMYNWYGEGAGIVWTNRGTVENVYMVDSFVEMNPDPGQGDGDYIKLYFSYNSGTITNILSNNCGLQSWSKVDENYSSFRLTETITPYASDVTGTVTNVRVFADWEVNEGNIANSFASSGFNSDWVVAYGVAPILKDNNLLA
jgi:hypothetical protein